MLVSTVTIARVEAQPGTPVDGYLRMPGIPASAVPEPLREIGFDQKIGEALPGSLTLKDEQGQVVRLERFFTGKPIILAFVYFECPMLCSLTLSGLSTAVDALSLQPGRDFEILAVSFDPRDTPERAAIKKATYARHRSQSGWHFLTGERTALETLTSSAGFRYTWDKGLEQFAHPTGIVILTPDGRVARYLFGIDYGARQLRLALVEASEGRLGTPLDAATLFCYDYDPMAGRYGLVIMRVIRVASTATVLLLATLILVLLRREP
jgi:protein SCO1/2